jgi:hypothetical protein
MPRGRIPTTSWSRGEIDPLLEGRVDLEQYYNGARTLENMLVRETGPAQRRPGTRFVGATKTPSETAKLVPFIFSESQVYMLLFGEGYIWVYKDNARVGTVEIPTPYLEEDLPLLRFEQSADVLYIACTFYQPRVLERYSDTDWRLKVFPPTQAGTPPSREYGERPSATVTPSATTGTGVTFTASAAQFLASDVGRFIAILAGANAGARALITGFTSSTQVTGDVIDNFVTLAANAATDWKLTDSPVTTCTPSAAGPVGATITLTLGAAGWRSTDVGKFVFINGGTCLITSITTTTVANAKVLTALSGTTAAQGGAWLLEETAWSSFNGFPAAVSFGPGDRLFWAGTLAQPTTVWGSAVGDYTNYAAGSLDDEAVEFSLNTREVNQIVWLASGKDLIAGTLGVGIPITTANDTPLTPSNPPSSFPEARYGASPLVAPVKVGNAILFPSRSGRRLRELVYRYEEDAYRAPDLLQLAGHLTRGAGPPPDGEPVTIPRRLVDLAYQEEPVSTIWAVREDGVLLACTYLRYENVVAWSRVVMNGRVEAVAVIPHPDQDREQVWLIVRRNIGGAVCRYVEYLDDSTIVYDRRHVDAAVTYDFTVTGKTCQPLAVEGIGVTFVGSGGPFAVGDVGKQIRNLQGTGIATITAFTDADHVTADIIAPFPSTAPMASGAWALCPFTLTGLGHLDGYIVDVQGDGVAFPQQLVVGGAITLDATAVRLEVGSHYSSILTTVRPGQLEQALDKRLGEILVRLHESLGMTVNGEAVTFRSTSDPLDTPPPLFTGDKKVTKLGIDNEGRITIRQDQPLPLTVSYVSGLYQTGA